MEYTPQQPAQQAVPPPSYELVKDVSGKPPVHRGPVILDDGKGHQLKAPFAPNPKCKRCLGRGYVGLQIRGKKSTGEVVYGDLIPCVKCFTVKK